MSDARKNAMGTVGFGVIFGFLILVGLAFVPSVSHRAFVAVETAEFPVVGLATISGPRDVLGGCEFSAAAEKLRSCPWRRTLVYLGQRNGMNVLISTAPHRDAPTLRDVGVLEWQRVFVPVGCADVGKTFADAYHQCRQAGGSMTRSRLWNNSTGVE